MSKRLVRIASSRLPDQLPRLLKHELSGVLNNGKTYFGVLVSLTNDELTLEDSRQHRHTLAFADLYEVVYDANPAPRIKT